MKTILTASILLMLCAPLLAFADDGGAAAVAAPKAAGAGADDDGFEKVDGSMLKGESIPADRLVGAAYGFILCAFVGFTVSVALRNRRVEEELEALRKKLEGPGAK